MGLIVGRTKWMNWWRGFFVVLDGDGEVELLVLLFCFDYVACLLDLEVFKQDGDEDRSGSV